MGAPRRMASTWPWCQHGRVPTVRSCVFVAALSILCAACASGSPSTHLPASLQEATPAGLRAAANAWANAFLTGTVSDITGMEAPACQVPGNAGVASSDLQAMRTRMERHFGIALTSVRVTAVQLRNVTSTSGEAEVEYDLSPSLAGDDNWVTYGYQDGQWKVTDCHAPIGGQSSSSSTSSASTP